MDLIEQNLVDENPSISTANEVRRNGEEVYCYKCNRRLTKDLYFFSYGCYLCMSCYPLPNQIYHWLHPQHLLTLQTKFVFTTRTSNSALEAFCFICDGCLYVSFGIVYVCQSNGIITRSPFSITRSHFKCCIECSFSTATRMPIQWDHKKKSIFHYIHLHELTICRYKRRLDIRDRDCLICELPLWGVCYGCVRCFCFIHESCVDSPEQISHPIHPSHPLNRLNYAQDYSHEEVCKGCSLEIYKRKHFFCEECGDFNLHLKCADSLLLTIRHEGHRHVLLYGIPTSFAFYSRCGICNKFVCRQVVPFYRCEECDLTFHFKCIIPRNFKHRYHMHSLSLVSSFSEGDCHCSICETSIIDLNGHVYCCRQCNFVAHIACVVSQDEDSPKFLSCLSAAAAYTKALSGNNNDEQIKHMGHKHELRLSDVPTNLKHCKMCDLEIGDRAYACQQCEDFWVHKKCAELPEELHHPLHGCRPLTLLKNFRYGSKFVCGLCRDVSDTFCFLCRACGFIIDVKCAFATQLKDSTGHMDHPKELDHDVFGHLQLVNPTGKFASISCKVCNQKISGSRYVSLNNDDSEAAESEYFHVTCTKLALEVKEHPLDPNHPLFLRRLYDRVDGFIVYNDICGACGYRISAYGYVRLAKGPFSLHIECAHSPSRFLKHKVHKHRLYYFQRRPSNIRLKRNHRRLGRRRHEPNDRYTQVCTRCDRKIKIKGPYYRCVKCKLNFHLKCLRLPRVVKHKWHLHPLVYKESVEFGGWYCDICEEKRDGEHPVYCCEDCKIAAHVDCLVSEENASNVKIENEDTIAPVDNSSDEQEEESEEMDDISSDEQSDEQEEESEETDDNSNDEQEEESEETDDNSRDEQSDDNSNDEQEEESEETDDNTSDEQEEESEEMDDKECKRPKKRRKFDDYFN